ncbi:MAG: hypothetical protein Q9194_000747 [Teloschistes cf. exilis]
MSDSKPLTACESGTTGIIEARTGKAFALKKGQSLKLINTHGAQVIDFFAFALDVDLRPLPPPAMHFLSMQHTRSGGLRLSPKSGSKLLSNLRKPIFTIDEDTSPGVHDTLVPACDSERYRQLGVQGHHDSCAENLQIASEEHGCSFPKDLTPAPLNLWMNVPVKGDGSLSFVEPVSREGDCVVLKAEENCLAVGQPQTTHFPISLSRCPTQPPQENVNQTERSIFPLMLTTFFVWKKGEIPSFKLFESDRLLAFLDIQPLSLGHALVVPKHHGAKLTDIPDESLTEILVHFHVVQALENCSMRTTEGLGIEWPAQKTDMDKLKALFNEVKAKM